jgi:hypothetical protein
MAKKFVEYSGDIVTDEKDPFAKGESGFALGTTEQQNKDIGDDWWHLPLATALGGALGAAGTYLYNQNKDKSLTPPIDRTRDIPMGNQPVAPPTGQSRTLAEAQQMAAKALEGRVVSDAAKSVAQEAATQATQAVAPPTITESVQAGQSPTKAIQADIAPMVDQAVAPPAEKSVQARTRRTAEQIAAELEASIKNAPEGRLPSAPNPKKTNKLLPSDVIGQGGWHWYQGQMGPEAEAEWLRQFGRTNQSYADVKQAVKEGRLAGPVVPEGKKGGAFPREATVPNYIKGGVKPEMALNLAGNAIGAVGLGQAFKHAQKTGDWSDFGLGLAGQILGNIAPRAGMAFGLMSPSQLSSGTLDSPEARALGVKPTR